MKVFAILLISLGLALAVDIPVKGGKWCHKKII